MEHFCKNVLPILMEGYFYRTLKNIVYNSEGDKNEWRENKGGMSFDSSWDK